MKLLIFGSSIAWGAWDKEGGWAQRLKDFTYNKAEETNFQEYTSVYCLGVSGDNTVGLLERFDTEVKARTKQNEGEKLVILIEIGINDSQYVFEEKQHRVPEEEFRKNLLTLIEKSKKHNADLIFLGLTPVDGRVDPIPWAPSKTYRAEFVEKYEQILKEVTQQEKIPFIETMTKFPKTELGSLLVDGVHPSTEGHIIIFEEVKRNLIEKKIL